MNVFVLVRKEFEEIEEMKVFKSKNAAVNYVLNFYKDYEYDEADIKMIEKILIDNSTFFDDYGNDSITWQIYETKLEG